MWIYNCIVGLLLIYAVIVLVYTRKCAKEMGQPSLLTLLKMPKSARLPSKERYMERRKNISVIVSKNDLLFR